MVRTLEEWFETLDTLLKGTEYKVINNNAKGSAAGVAIVPREKESPQRIAIYPKKTKGAGLVMEMDVYDKMKDIIPLDEPARIKGNRPHYNDQLDELILKVCELFKQYFI